MASYSGEGRGLARVANAFSAEGRGLHRVVNAFHSEGRGLHRVRNSFHAEGRGLHRILRAYAAYARGLNRVANNALVRYELFVGVDAPPAFTAAPVETFTSLPHTTAATWTGTKKLYVVLRKRNAYNLSSQNVEYTLIELIAGAATPTRPSAPSEITLSAAAGGTGSLKARYGYAADGVNQADKFQLWYTTDGFAPDPTDPPDAEATMVKADGVARLNYTIPAQADGTVVKALVRVARTIDESTDAVSDNVAIVTVTADTDGPVLPASREAFYSQGAAQAQ